MSETSIASLLEHLGLTGEPVGTVEVINPSTAKKIYDLPQLSAAQVAYGAAKAREAQPDWAKTEVRERAEILLRLHDLIIENEDRLLDLVQLETGKSRGHAFEEIGGALGSARYYGKIAQSKLKRRRAKSGLPFYTKAFVDQVPVGVVGVITPWNYPLALATLDVLPALVAGNSVLQKTDNQTTLTALFTRRLAIEAGLPPEVWTIVTGDGAEVGNAVTDNVDYVAFTGSTATGRLVAQRAAARLIGYSLGLGGKNPLIVLPSAKLGQAAEIALGSAIGSGGQLCVSVERIYVPNHMKLAFEAEIATRVESLQIGKSNEYDKDLGSLTSAAQLDRVDGFVKDAVSKGARVIAGGHALIHYGPYFYAPTVLTDINDAMRLDRAEVFGPIMQVYGYETVEDAIKLANDSVYGLNASIVGNRAEAMLVAAQINAGSVNINEGFRGSFASMDSPMGGMKSSGSGRRNGVAGLLRFTESKTIGVASTILKLPTRGKQYVSLAALFKTLSKALRALPFLKR
jgi:succinate-semialdehyde dehydrogenase/glutarate-semialdehyde dehydrogenase